MAADSCVDAGGESRLRNLRRHVGLLVGRGEHGDAGAIFDQPERGERHGCILTLANGFQHCLGAAADTFAIDPNLRVGYAQNWQLSAQRDLAWALVMTATYLGTKGTHGMQEFLPDTYPIGAANPCPSCQSGFVYRTSGGNSTRRPEHSSCGAGYAAA